MARRALFLACVVAWALALAWTRTFTLPADAACAAAIVAGGVVALRRLPPAEPRPWQRGAILLWGGLAVAVVVFELVMLFHGPRSHYPTISSLTNGAVFGHAWGRPIFGAVWLALGGYLLRCAQSS